jgi:hypothetical protein
LRAERAPLGLLAGLAGAIAASTWVHGNWYLWALPLAAFAVAGERRVALRLTACVGVGCALGAVATGHPLAFLGQTLAHPLWALGGGASLRVVVTEFHPTNGSPILLLAVGALLLDGSGRAGAGRSSSRRSSCSPPWLATRPRDAFWSDWGRAPRLAAFSTRALAERFAWGRRRLALAAAAAAALFLSVTADTGGRWSRFPATRLASLELPAFRAWLPEPGGVVYSNELYAFYDLFFRHPHAEWRSLLGFEPSLMPPRVSASSVVLEGASGESLRRGRSGRPRTG